MAILTGTELVTILPVTHGGYPAAETILTTTQDIADLGGGGGNRRVIFSVSSNTIAGDDLATDYVYFCTNSPTIELPDPFGNTNLYTIKNKDSGVTTIQSVSGTIDGEDSVTLFVENASYNFVSDNTNWNIV